MSLSDILSDKSTVAILIVIGAVMVMSGGTGQTLLGDALGMTLLKLGLVVWGIFVLFSIVRNVGSMVG